MNIKFCLPILLLVLLGCKTIEPSKGKFFRGIASEKERFFVHDRVQGQNPLIKITDEGGYGYYAWKTIKTVVEAAPKTDVSVYQTVTNDSLLSFKNDKLAYIQKEKNVRVNNLYFIDDYRCIYLSFDDVRVKDRNATILPMYFDKKDYPIERSLKKRFGQYLRGYYTLKGKDLFFHFESPYDPTVNYFVKGKVSDDAQSISFVSMTVPDSPNELYSDGYNVEYKKFAEIFAPQAQPIFEVVEPIADLIFIPQNYVTLGFEHHVSSKPYNTLHKALLEKYKTYLKPQDTLVIKKVTYHLCDDDNGDEDCDFRRYEVYKYGIPVQIFAVDEKIGLDDLSNQVLISTW